MPYLDGRPRANEPPGMVQGFSPRWSPSQDGSRGRRARVSCFRTSTTRRHEPAGPRGERVILLRMRIELVWPA